MRLPSCSRLRGGVRKGPGGRPRRKCGCLQHTVWQLLRQSPQERPTEKPGESFAAAARVALRRVVVVGLQPAAEVEA